jgi:hypothetical protein
MSALFPCLLQVVAPGMSRREDSELPQDAPPRLHAIARDAQYNDWFLSRNWFFGRNPGFAAWTWTWTMWIRVIACNSDIKKKAVERRPIDVHAQVWVQVRDAIQIVSRHKLAWRLQEVLIASSSGRD